MKSHPLTALPATQALRADARARAATESRSVQRALVGKCESRAVQGAVHARRACECVQASTPPPARRHGVACERDRTDGGGQGEDLPPPHPGRHQRAVTRHQARWCAPPSTTLRRTVTRLRRPRWLEPRCRWRRPPRSRPPTVARRPRTSSPPVLRMRSTPGRKPARGRLWSSRNSPADPGLAAAWSNGHVRGRTPEPRGCSWGTSEARRSLLKTRGLAPGEATEPLGAMG